LTLAAIAVVADQLAFDLEALDSEAQLSDADILGQSVLVHLIPFARRATPAKLLIIDPSLLLLSSSMKRICLPDRSAAEY